MYGFLNCGNNTDGGVRMKKKYIEFLKKNGFLLFLFICVCVVAAGTIYIATKDFRAVDKPKLDDLIILDDSLEKPGDIAEVNPDEVKNEDSGEDNENKVVEATTDETNNDLSKEDPAEDVTDNPEDVVPADNLDDLEFVDDEDEDDEEDVEIVTEKSTQGILPIEGEILTDFTTDTLIYSKTLEEWRSHRGIDIKASEGTKVKAPLDGTIKEVYEDELWGIVIIIDHGGGLETKLANLGTKEMVKPGVKVSKGDYISTIGKSADIEMALEPHLHYEVIKNGKMIDPRSISR